MDRLGRNYGDVTEVIRQLMARGVVVRTVINGLLFDGATKDSMQKAVRDALIAFMAATAAAWAGPAPGPGLCWYYTERSRWQGFWNACQ